MENITETTSSTLPTGTELIIPAPYTLTFQGATANFINQGTLTNTSVIALVDNSTFENFGTYQGNGTFIGNFVNSGVVNTSD